ncbi:MAG TPA: autotransporter domain-containing protein, partial [Xanthobacteraceae bacterium]
VTIATFAGGITNAGTISAGGNGIWLGGTATLNASYPSGTAYDTVAVTIATFGGGISNAGTITAGGAGIFVGGSISVNTPSNNVFVTISTFSGGISNSGTISGATGILVTGNVLTFSGAIANSGTITGTGGTAIDVSGANNAITIDQTAGLIVGAIKLSANADVLNITGGTVSGSIVGAGSLDTVNFGPGFTATYGGNSAIAITGVNALNIAAGTIVLDATANSATTVTLSGGTLQVGDASNTGAVLTAATLDVTGGTLSGHGTIDSAVTVDSGGTLSPGGSIGTLTVNGSLVFNSGSTYGIALTPTAHSLTEVTGAPGTVTINGGTVVVTPQLGTYGPSTFAILTSTGTLTGTFNPTIDFIGRETLNGATLTYNGNDVFLSYQQTTNTLQVPSGANANQENVANAINAFFLNGGTLPAGLQNLGSFSDPTLLNSLSQLSGEPATDADKGAFHLMNDFLELMLDPTAGGGGGISGGGATGFAPEQDASLPADVALAYAKAMRQAPSQPSPASGGGLGNTFDQRWTAWGSAFGGASHVDGDAATGSNNVTASDYGFAAGMDYHVTPDTVYGFGLAGGGTNWSLAQGLGSGRSDSFQAGVYAKTHAGPFYVSGALAFANHWFTTNRTVLGDQLQASFTGQSYAARGEAGYRYGLPITGVIIGVTPYAALQVQDFHTPSYSETDLTGGGFGLSYNSMNATDTRSELGARFDNLQIVYGMPLVLRGRLAWAHDWVSSSSLGAAFQSLPGSSFTVNGATQPQNSALTTAAAELHLTANWTAIAKFDGEFAAGAQTYGGTGTLKYSW